MTIASLFDVSFINFVSITAPDDITWHGEFHRCGRCRFLYGTCAARGPVIPALENIEVIYG